MNDAHVLFMNDMPLKVVIGSMEFADEQLLAVAKERFVNYRHYVTVERFMDECHFRVRTVAMVNENDPVWRLTSRSSSTSTP